MDSNELEFPVIRNTSVVDSVKDWITDQMIKGNLRPGSKLPTEAELSQRLGVGRNSVREAIKQMEAYGVLYIKRAEGTFVAEQFDPKMLSPIFYSIILQNASWQDFVDLRRAIDIGTLYVLIGLGPKKRRTRTPQCRAAESRKSRQCQKAGCTEDYGGGLHLPQRDHQPHEKPAAEDAVGIYQPDYGPQPGEDHRDRYRKRRDRQVCSSASGTLSDCV